MEEKERTRKREDRGGERLGERQRANLERKLHSLVSAHACQLEN